MATITYVTREQITERVKRILSEEGMTYQEFVEHGEADTFEDWYVEDLWLTYRDFIIR